MNIPTSIKSATRFLKLKSRRIIFTLLLIATSLRMNQRRQKHHHQHTRERASRRQCSSRKFSKFFQLYENARSHFILGHVSNHSNNRNWLGMNNNSSALSSAIGNLETDIVEDVDVKELSLPSIGSFLVQVGEDAMKDENVDLEKLELAKLMKHQVVDFGFPSLEDFLQNTETDAAALLGCVFGSDGYYVSKSDDEYC